MLEIGAHEEHEPRNERERKRKREKGKKKRSRVELEGNTTRKTTNNPKNILRLYDFPSPRSFLSIFRANSGSENVIKSSGRYITKYTCIYIFKIYRCLAHSCLSAWSETIRSIRESMTVALAALWLLGKKWHALVLWQTQIVSGSRTMKFFR